MHPQTIIESKDKPKSQTLRRLPIVLTARDTAVLADLLDSRLLTLAQIADIHFDGKREAAKKRLQGLKKARLISGRPRVSRSEPEPLRITHAGFDWLVASGQLAERPKLTWKLMSARLKVSPLTVRHELSVGDVKAAIYRGSRAVTNLSVRQFITWTRLLRFTVRDGRLNEQTDVSPDGFFQIERNRDEQRVSFDFFVEVDRATETLSRIVDRAAAYVAFYLQGGYAKRRGGQGAEAKHFPFRVLWTFPTRTRLEGFAKACREHNPPILKMMWLATLADVLRDPFGPIWTRPVDANKTELQSLLPS